MTIIAVDDERRALELITKELTEYDPNHNIVGFTDSSDALEFAKNNPIDIAFLDVQMYGYNGIDLAEFLQQLNPQINIVFTTGYSQYMEKAFELHASGYLQKPITREMIAKEMSHLRYPVEKTQPRKRAQAFCFGNFDFRVDGVSVSFKYEKCRELLAYLVDRKGSFCTSKEIMAVLWEDDLHGSYLRNIRKSLIDTLTSLGCEDLIASEWGIMRIVPEKIDCDYYHWLKKDPGYEDLWTGEYMNQYSWAETTNSLLFRTKKVD